MVPADASELAPMTTDSERKSSTLGTRPRAGAFPAERPSALDVIRWAMGRGSARWGKTVYRGNCSVDFGRRECLFSNWNLVRAGGIK